MAAFWGSKGLKAPRLILCVNGFKDMGTASEQRYMGLSRARTLLVVVGDSQLMEQAGGRGWQGPSPVLKIGSRWLDQNRMN